MLDVDARFRNVLVERFQRFQAWDQHVFDLMAQFAAFVQRLAGQKRQHPHRHDEHPEAKGHPPRYGPTPLHLPSTIWASFAL